MYDILRDIVKKSSTNKPFRENISKRLGSLRIFLSFRYDLRKCITPKRQISACVYNIKDFCAFRQTVAVQKQVQSYI